MTRRLFAFLADCGTFLLFGILTIGILMLAGMAEKTERLARPILILWLAFIVLSLRFSGTTLGKYAFNVEVRSSRPGRTRPAIWELAMRETLFRWMSCLCFIGYYHAFSDKWHRSWSDRMVNTVV